MRLGTTRTPGVESLGQNLLAMLVTYLMLFLALLLPIILAGAAFAAVAPGAIRAAMDGSGTVGGIGPWAIGIAAAAGVLTLWSEVLATVLWLGRVFERTEPGNE
jgi:hypothetical protein